MATFTNQTKNTSTFTNQGLSWSKTWDDSTVAWDDSSVTWTSSSPTFTNQSKNTSTFTNQTKN